MATILYIEDDEKSRQLVKQLLEFEGHTIILSQNGEDGIKDALSRRPDLILLDLNMPKMNGIEFLKVVKADENLRMIPVVVLTTSHEQRDIVESFELSAAGYMVKSADYAEFARIIRMIDKYWTLSETPGQAVMS